MTLQTRFVNSTALTETQLTIGIVYGIVASSSRERKCGFGNRPQSWHCNDLATSEANAHLLKYDSVHGRFDADVKVAGNKLIVNGREIPANIPYDVLKKVVTYQAQRDGVALQ